MQNCPRQLAMQSCILCSFVRCGTSKKIKIIITQDLYMHYGNSHIFCPINVLKMLFFSFYWYRQQTQIPYYYNHLKLRIKLGGFPVAYLAIATGSPCVACIKGKRKKKHGNHSDNLEILRSPKTEEQIKLKTYQNDLEFQVGFSHHH